jgi:D-alanyl-lipoteichoic acid acyltransferase DltB (MBOAT superfamily)
MLFNSIEFIAGFLPVALLGFIALARWRPGGPALAWLLAASLFFYGWWDYRNLFIIVPSIILNYVFGWLIGAAREAGRKHRAAWLTGLGVAANLAAIGYFKYFGFVTATLADLSGLDLAVRGVLLPLGISFFTFQQIKFLVDRHAAIAPQPPPLHYALLVSFFPHVIAGPIVNYDELLPQFRKPGFFAFDLDLLVDGIAFFLLGLAKKVVLADQFGLYANQGFNAASGGAELTFFAAWAAALSYTLQLYFDFSGYSDMAFGLARMFGLRFPINFNSPYKAVNIIDFWRRWHITLSRFLRDYLYIPLGGNRHGTVRRYTNLLITMLLGGLWHGAGWTFIFWGGLHGVYLLVNHAWRGARRAVDLPASTTPSRAGAWLGRALTLLCVVIGWVFFRADSFPSALSLLRGMTGGYGAELPDQLIALLPALSHVAHGAGVVRYIGDDTVLGFGETFIMLGFGLAVALLGPNLYEISFRTRLLFVVASFAFTVKKVLFSAAAVQFLYFRF